jgi:hypothetical protein
MRLALAVVCVLLLGGCCCSSKAEIDAVKARDHAEDARRQAEATQLEQARREHAEYEAKAKENRRIERAAQLRRMAPRDRENEVRYCVCNPCDEMDDIVASGPTPAERIRLQQIRQNTNCTGTPSKGGTGAFCRDGTPANCTGRGCCSHHGGVAR